MARLAKLKGIFEQCGLTEPTLQHFFSSFEGIKVSTTCKLVTNSQTTLNLPIGNASPNDLVGTILEKIWFLPEEIPDLR